MKPMSLAPKTSKIWLLVWDGSKWNIAQRFHPDQDQKYWVQESYGGGKFINAQGWVALPDPVLD